MQEQDMLNTTAKLTKEQESASCENNCDLGAPRIELATALHDGTQHMCEKVTEQIQDSGDLCVERPKPRKAKFIAD